MSLPQQWSAAKSVLLPALRWQRQPAQAVQQRQQVPAALGMPWLLAQQQAAGAAQPEPLQAALAPQRQQAAAAQVAQLAALAPQQQQAALAPQRQQAAAAQVAQLAAAAQVAQLAAAAQVAQLAALAPQRQQAVAAQVAQLAALAPQQQQAAAAQAAHLLAVQGAVAAAKGPLQLVAQVLAWLAGRLLRVWQQVHPQLQWWQEQTDGPLQPSVACRRAAARLRRPLLLLPPPPQLYLQGGPAGARRQQGPQLPHLRWRSIGSKGCSCFAKETCCNLSRGSGGQGTPSSRLPVAPCSCFTSFDWSALNPQAQPGSPPQRRQ